MLFYYVQVEKLIKEVSNVRAGCLRRGVLGDHKENGIGFREAQSMLLERIAREISRLKAYIVHAQVYSSSHFNQVYALSLLMCMNVCVRACVIYSARGSLYSVSFVSNVISYVWSNCVKLKIVCFVIP